MRKINELIWHTTATPEGREVSVAEIDQWHKERGWSGIGYHKVVHLDGTVSEGRRESQVGAHVAGHNSGTLGYVYVGGLTKDGKKPKDTRTPAQKMTMLRLTRQAIAKYGLIKISGHRDYASKACPSFDARREYSPLLQTAMGMPAKDPARLSHSRTIMGASMAGTGGAAMVADGAQELVYASEQAESALNAGTILGIVLGLVILAGALFAIYARWDDAGRPVPWRRKEAVP